MNDKKEVMMVVHRYEVRRALGVLIVIVMLAVLVSGCIEPTETKILKSFLDGRLSSEYMEKHFEITNTYKSQVFFNIRYGSYSTNTKVSSANFSGFGRVSNGSISEYYGPLKEYELKIEKEEAQAIFKTNNCTGDLTLEVGDFIQSEKEELKGLYWRGGSPANGRLEDSCIVDAESGAFRIEKGQVNMLIPGERT